MKNYFSLYWQLSKPKIVLLVLVTQITGFLFASETINAVLLFWNVLATYFLASGSSVLNHYMEKDVDALMLRTCQRPLPQKKISPTATLILALSLILLGGLLFYKYSNTLTLCLALGAAVIYNGIYTPMKKISHWNTFVGSIPGALPPLWGWTAVTNHINFGGFILFLILLCWQQPHFFAIAWLLKDDYRRANLKMLPVVDPSGRKTFLYILLSSLLLIPLSLLPSAMRMTGNFYFYATFMLGIAFFLLSIKLTATPSTKSARSLLIASVIYLPLLLIIILGDRLL